MTGQFYLFSEKAFSSAQTVPAENHNAGLGQKGAFPKGLEGFWF
jgi:hypothetical protein